MAPNSIDETYKAYLTGIIDGEGSICLVSSKGYRFPRVVIYQKNQLDFLTELQQIYGGSLTVIKRSGVHQLMFERNEYILHILEDVYPYLRFKKQKAEIVIAVCKLRQHGGVPSVQNQLLRARYEEAFDQVNVKVQ